MIISQTRSVDFDWQRVYREIGNPLPSLSLSKLPIPSESCWTIITNQDLGFEPIIDCCKRLGFFVHTAHMHCQDLPWVPDAGIFYLKVPALEVEACSSIHSGNLLSTSTSQRFITLKARLLLAIAFYMATGSHLDGRQTATLCAGTISKIESQPFIPAVGWKKGKAFETAIPLDEAMRRSAMKCADSPSDKSWAHCDRLYVNWESPFSRTQAVVPRTVVECGVVAC